MARMMRPRRALHRRGAQVGSFGREPWLSTATRPHCPQPLPGSAHCWPGCRHQQRELTRGRRNAARPAIVPVDIPGVAVNRVAAASVDLGQDAVQGSYDPCFLFTACDPIAADHRGGLAITNDHLGADPAVRFTTSVDSRRQTNRTPADPVTERARGTRAESALLAIIETRRDDPRALLLRTAAWSRERGRTSG